MNDEGNIHITTLSAEPPKTSSPGELAVDVYEDDHKIVIVAPIACISATEIEILVDGDLLTIKGQRTPPVELKTMKTYASECFWGAFERTIALPEAVNSADTSAHFKNSILTITIPKARKVTAKTIKISA